MLEALPKVQFLLSLQVWISSIEKGAYARAKGPKQAKQREWSLFVVRLIHRTKPGIAVQQVTLMIVQLFALETIKEAMIFGLAVRASLEQIKARHRKLVKIHHPDHGENVDSEMIRNINCAYEVVITYCENYRYCFVEEEFLEQVPEERLRRQFGWDPVWSGQKESDND